MNDIPVVVFAFNRPDKLRRVLAALRGQELNRLIIFVDGPRGAQDARGVDACRELARRIDWTETELILSETNAGVASLREKIHQVLQQSPAAIFLEDDCLPAQGFYAFMRRALEHYQDHAEVFSIGGYQPLGPEFFRGYACSLISGARFIGWGWATWRERWQRAWPLMLDYRNLFEGLARVPEIAGADIGPVARQMAAGTGLDNWDLRVALAALALKQVHLAPASGLIRNIGQDTTGMHGSLSNRLRARFLHNRNVAERAPDEICWLEDLSLNCDYVCQVRDFVARSRSLSIRRWAQRGARLLGRVAGNRTERLTDLDLIAAGAQALPRRALLAYITHPFTIDEDDPRFNRHINIWHAREIVRALNRLGYMVDAIDYRDTTFRPVRQYDLFIGHGGINFAAIAGALATKTPKIYFSTGSYWRYHNQQEHRRLQDLQRRRGVALPPDRRIEHDEDRALRLADGVIGIGNEHTRATYRDWERVWMIPGTARYDDTYEWCPLDDLSRRKNFLFFASGGNVHKGLDLLLEAFAGMQRRDIELWIMAPLEAAFRRVYRRELFELPQVHALGSVQPRSCLYYRTLARCAWVVLPSCSEGQAQSVVEAMQAGLIPLVSRAAGVDVDGFGEVIEPVSPPAILDCLLRCAEQPDDALERRSRLAKQAARGIYAPEAFGRNFRAALEAALAGAQRHDKDAD